jgi:hypothetical protein
MCDNALVTGLALNRQPVDREMVLEVSRDFVLRRETEDVVPATTPEPVVEEPSRFQEPAMPVQQPDEPRDMFRQPKPTRFPLFGFGRR